MQLNLTHLEQAVRAFDFRRLFIEELGWDRHAQELTVNVDGHAHTLKAVAEKRGMVAMIHRGPDGRVPDHATRRKVERLVGKAIHEHLIIFTDTEQSTQVWQWVKREPGKPVAAREHVFYKAQKGTALVQKLAHLAVGLDEEERLTLVDVTGRAKAAFDVERVTKRFFDRFKKEHGKFLTFIKGIREEADREWYASLMLNRLMFVYFIQKKRFLDNDPNYLRSRLALIQQRRGKDKFMSFYRHFLMRLFHDGLGAPAHDKELVTLIGRVPYLNGGLFDVHELERNNPAIEIPDEAFVRLFDFFDAYQWHLDERPVGADDEINPDVIGYIFEKYINQKELGAYYTKDDITHYMTRNTVIPRLLAMARRECDVAFRSGASLWAMLSEDPDRYIYPMLRHGLDQPLPAEIEAATGAVDLRGDWNTLVGNPALAFEAETWREMVARRAQAVHVKSRLTSGAITSVDELVSLNADVEQFAQDVVAQSEGPELLRAIYRALEQITVLDPACGSGAFLFAALNVLEPLYETCLDRMQVFLDDSQRPESPIRPEQLADFKEILDRVARHPNRRYFVLKSIMVNNLFGVDLMHEAVEICKLRLFLKLMAQAEELSHIEPLPDIDFNVRSGNTLVGFATFHELERLFSARLDFDDTLGKIRERAQGVASAFHAYQGMQTDGRGDKKDMSSAKRALQEQLTSLGADLDVHLSKEYGTTGTKAFAKWKHSHQPFHWVVEFYGHISRGGFDVVVGNPPYIEYGKVKESYTVLNFATLDCGNLYAFVTERSMELLQPEGRLGFIIPVASVCTDGYAPLQGLLKVKANLVVSTFNDRPGKLFDGLEHIRLAVILAARSPEPTHTIHTSKYNRWLTSERDQLFQTLAYANSTAMAGAGSLAKIGGLNEASILRKVMGHARPLEWYARNHGRHKIYYTRKLSGFVQVLDFVPTIYGADNKKREPSELKEIGFESAEIRDAFLALLNSNLFFWYLSVVSDCRNLNKREVHSIRLDMDRVPDATRRQLSALARRLMKDIGKNSEVRKMVYKKHGTMRIQCIFPKLSKPIIDEIDRVLAGCYGFTPEEVDFLVNYDLKYRVGTETEDEGE